MKKIHFPEPFVHKHQPLRNVNEIIDEKLTVGQRMANSIARIVGSWVFIITQSVILVFWVIFNIVAWASHWDPYPFILMNLFLSLQAAYTAPVIMMSQNRLAARDRIDAHQDFLINRRLKRKYVLFLLILQHRIRHFQLFTRHLIIYRNSLLKIGQICKDEAGIKGW
jgi:uncharacterized membrane protein